jgi:tetratricopeptide (TPR) repeat protein
MPAPIDHFTRSEVLRMVGITSGQLGYWERLQLIQPTRTSHKKVYSFGDLVSLRAVKQLKARRVPASLLRSAIDALQKQLIQAEIPLTQLRIRSHGSKIAVEYEGVAIEPLSGQLLMNFKKGSGRNKVSTMPTHKVEGDFTLALEYESCPELRLQAIEAYRRILTESPGSFEAHTNLGALLYAKGDFREAAECFRRALAVEQSSPLAHFNLGTVAEDMGALDTAMQQLTEALRLKEDYADAHYNLARVHERLGNYLKARHHWRRYLKLDPNSRWARYARTRLGESHSS